MPKKRNFLEDPSMSFFSIFFQYCCWKLVDEFLFLLNIVLSSHFCWFVNVDSNLILKLTRDICFIQHPIEDFDVIIFLSIIWGDFSDDISDCIDIIGEDNTTHHLDKDEKSSLQSRDRMNITKSNS